MSLNFNDPAFAAWGSTARNVLDAIYGRPQGEMHPNTSAIMYATSGEPEYVGMDDEEIQRHHVLEQRKRKALLEEYIRQLEILSPSAAFQTPDQFQFHSQIERVSRKLYNDGHYKQAALEAYIRVITAVKEKSGLDALDGDNLMNRAFGCDKQTPVIQFNSLRTEEEKDEQRGFMYLYKGVVGLRNSKAHSNRLIEDPKRAHEYLALASLLMRVLDLATVDHS
jgi:uncharacterized protein (TIGR02391 family)